MTGSAPSPVVIVGAGVSGLAAAVLLAEAGIPVVVLEQRAYAGGRAYSFTDRRTGETVDNGQHLLIAGYAATFRYLRAIGSDRLVRFMRPPSLHLHHPVHGFGSLRLPPLPAPLHFAVGVMGFDLLAAGDRARLLRAGSALRGIRPGDASDLDTMTIDAWLDRQEQSAEARRTFWEPLAVSILNETLARGSAWPFLHALQTAFLRSRAAATLAVPAAGLSSILVDPGVQFITRRGGEVRTSADVASLIVEQDAVRGVLLRTGEVVPAGAVILAVPWHEASRLMPAGVHEAESSAAPLRLQSSPIVSVHLWFEKDLMDHPITGLVGRRVQWLFNRRRLIPGGAEGGHVSAVISGAHAFVEMDQDELIALAVEDLRSAYPAFPTQPLSGLVIREKRATPSLVPGTDRVRPGVQTGVWNLFLAGDWTDTGLPATLEGGVLSGERAARTLAGCPGLRA